jgi:putative membrane-bound dehydrogenase-like protein
MIHKLALCWLLICAILTCVDVSCCHGDIKAGTAQREITPPVGLEIQHYYRVSVGVHDPLFARCLYLEDGGGNAVAIVCLDLITGGFEACDSLRAEIRKQAGVENSVINFSHSHSSAALGPRGRSAVSNDEDSKWNDATLDTIVAIVKQAKQRAEPVTFRAGRAPSRVGFNRRLVNKQTGHVYMGVNRDGPIVPWVNVLVADSKKTGKPISVLFETAAHPVIVPHTTKKTSADFPGAAVERIREELGEGVIAMFGQGCGGNINGFPLRSSYENAMRRGRELGDSALKAINSSKPIESKALQVKMARTTLPSRALPTEEEWQRMAAANKDRPDHMKHLNKIKALIDSGRQPPPRRLDVYAVMLGGDWCLTTMPHEMFCQYELWIDKHAPFPHTMTFAYTNGYEGYIAVDAAWKLGAKGGYEAASLPNWGGQVHSRHFGPPAVGCEKIIKDAIASLWPAGAVALIKPAHDAPQPMTPKESASKVRMPEGFALELVASEPQVHDPSCIAFDERGRLFVCELHGYNIEGYIDVTELNKTGVLDKKVRRLRWELMGGKIAEEATKRQYGVVKMLTDTDGDSVMDKADIWAKQLPPCYGVIPARGGIIVTCAPDIIFLADHDGDGKPEVRETLFTGFRTHVMERGVNNPRWGLDNWIYVGAGGNGGTITGPRLAKPVELRHSDFRIKADGSAIEPVNGRVGTFGLTINDVGDRFPSTGGRPAMYALPLPHRYLARNPHVATPDTNLSAATYNRGYRISKPHPWRVKRGQDPAWVKFYGARETNSNYFSGGCSNTYYGDAVFPEQYRGNIFYCEPSLNIVHRCVVTRDGPGYKGQRAPAEEESEFLASTDQWFRPMNLRVGPDGAIYIVDMYREIIEDYSAIPRFLQQQYGLNRGHDYGRIWRLSPKEATRRRFDDFSKFSTAQLAMATGDSNAWRRLTAQRLLVERGAKAAAESLSKRLRANAAPQTVIHAMYTLDGLGELRSADIFHVLDHEHYGVRLHALRLADRWLDKDEALLAKVVSMTSDPDPSVRLQLAMTLGESSNEAAVDALLTLAQKHGSERWMNTAVLSSSREHAGELLLALLQSSKASKAAQSLLQPLATTVASRRDVRAMSQSLTIIAGLDEATARPCLAGIVEGASRGGEPFPKSDDGWAPVSRLLASESDTIRDLATKLAAKLPLANAGTLRVIFGIAIHQATNTESSLDDRRAAIQVLASAPYEALAPVATKLLDATQPPALQRAAITSLAASSDKRVGAALLKNWPSFTPQVRSAVLNAIFARANRFSALLDAIDNGIVSRGEISAIQREQLTNAGDAQVAARAKKLFANSTASADLQKRIDRYQKALAGKRNFERGKLVFAKNCLACHKLGNEGHDVGPPLGTVINRPDETILLDLLDPSGRIEPEYRSYLVTTEDGRTFTGILASESPTSVTLRKDKGASDSILRKDIESISASGISLMPSNLHEQISPQDAADLIGFLRVTFSKAEKK